MSQSEEAVKLFQKGCACSQAILAAFGPEFGLPARQAMKLAAGFAGGMRMAEVCGAVTGAFMVLGLAKCGDNCTTMEGRSKLYEDIRGFAGKFRELEGSVMCRDLLGCDISTPEGMTKAKENGLFSTICEKLVRRAAQILETMI